MTEFWEALKSVEMAERYVRYKDEPESLDNAHMVAYWSVISFLQATYETRIGGV